MLSSHGFPLSSLEEYERSQESIYNNFLYFCEKKGLEEWKLADNAGSSISYMKRDVICSLMLLYSNGEIYYFQRLSSRTLGF